MRYYFFLGLIIAIAFSCAKKPLPDLEFSGAPTYVYKTKKDYFKNVPVLLSEDKSRIVAYPAPQDVFTNGKLAYPTKLKRGYLMDNRGIGEHVAFLRYTYEEYSKFKKAPSIDVMYKNIIDKDPLVELCDCGTRNQYTDTKLLNRLVKDRLKKCKRVK